MAIYGSHYVNFNRCFCDHILEWDAWVSLTFLVPVITGALIPLVSYFTILHSSVSPVIDYQLILSFMFANRDLLAISG